MNIVLIGYRGSGKTSIGRRLAERLGMGFVDSDVLIVERAGMTIKEIFAQRGEAGFRDLESAVIADLATRDGLVIALGGGAVLRAVNLATLKAGSGGAKVVWLRAEAEVLHERIAGDPATAAMRPALTVGGLEEVRGLLAVRTPLYAAVAEAVVDVGTVGVEEAAALLAARLGGSGEGAKAQQGQVED